VTHRKAAKERQLGDGREGRGCGRCSIIHDFFEKASSSINHSILSGQRGECLQINGTKINVPHINRTFVKVAITYLKVTRKF
jgi:hypothetical protein